MPAPVADLGDTLRLTAFFDFGNVFAGSVEFDEIRYSTGLGLTWLSPMGAMTLSYGIPLNDKDYDEIEEFQFSFGQVF
jgi:outer membrane protein insertion porin family